MSDTPEKFLAEKEAEHKAWLAKPLTSGEWLDLLMRCQNGQATCLFVLEKIEADIAAVAPKTPNASLPPLDPDKRRKMLIEIEVAEDFEHRLDNQWMVEREIHADRWSWNWKPSDDALAAALAEVEKWKACAERLSGALQGVLDGHCIVSKQAQIALAAFRALKGETK